MINHGGILASRDEPGAPASAHDSETGVIVRPGRLEDLPGLVPAHMAAFAGSLGVQLGARYAGAFLRWFIEDREAICLVAEQDGRIAGYVFGAPAGYSTRMNRVLAGTIALAVITHPHVLVRSGFLRQVPARLRALLGRSGAASDSATPETSGRTFRLTGIGVSPAFRRQGIAQALIRTYEEQVWERGYEAICLSVYAYNRGARMLYESCGWRLLHDGKVATYIREK